MRTSWVMLVSAAIVAVSFDAVSAITDADQVNIVSADSDIPSSDRTQRFLRTSKTIEKADEGVQEDVKSEVDDDEERVVPGTGLLDFTKTVSFRTLDDVAADLGVMRGSRKFIKPLQSENDWAMIKVAARKWKPERVDEVLDIAAKRATMTGDQLLRDPDYLFSKQYREFWNARKASA
ncbi:RxLR effector protein [Phytophthora megakarya]|uniref:RxLR effector protein n=1 Tax=Phytophthora megakarya TaxID=4795 RepID=A0A225UL13_9STRA|nr:RxLR effector protein [Phytophthora megakarya]